MGVKSQDSVTLTVEELRDIVKATVEETLTQLGVDAKNPIEMQKDFTHLREWRLTVVATRGWVLFSILGLLITGFGTAVWIGIKELVK